MRTIDKVPSISVAEIRREFGGTDQRVRNWIKSGKLEAEKDVDGNWKVSPWALEVFRQSWVEERRS